MLQQNAVADGTEFCSELRVRQRFDLLQGDIFSAANKLTQHIRVCCVAKFHSLTQFYSYYKIINPYQHYVFVPLLTF